MSGRTDKVGATWASNKPFPFLGRNDKLTVRAYALPELGQGLLSEKYLSGRGAHVLWFHSASAWTVLDWASCRLHDSCLCVPYRGMVHG
jgi:hypothetical protein